MKFIQDNPYRLLGVYANSPIKERLANNNKLKAFLKVGKEATFPLDQIEYLPSLHRTEESIASAEAMLTLPKDQIKYAQFWFIKQSPLDVVAFNHLLTGEMNKAVAIWEKKDYTSSLQNRMVCALIRLNLEEAINCATILYTSDEHLKEFVTSITGDESNYAIDDLIHTLLDTLCDEYGATQVLSLLKEASWKDYIGQRTIDPLIKNIEEEIEIAKKSRGKGCTVRLNAGRKLANATKQDLQTLKHLLSTDDIRYQMIADKLGLGILQCGIDYYNNSEAKDAAYHAIRLFQYALSIVVGDLAKNRCQENVRILQKIIANLPPEKICTEHAAIEKELHHFSKLPKSIEHAKELLRNCKSCLMTIKGEIGSNNAFYLKVSTNVINLALHNIIEEINEILESVSDKGIDRSAALRKKIWIIRAKLQEAWKAILIMDELDMEPEFRKNRYDENRASLKNLCKSVGINTYSFPAFTTGSATPEQPFKPIYNPYKPSSSKSTSAFTNTNKPSSKSKDEYATWGCLLIPVIIAVIALIMNVLSNYNSDCTSYNSTYNSETAYAVADSVASDSAVADEEDFTYEDFSTQEEKWLNQYKGHSLKTGATPYRSLYGPNSKIGDAGLKVKAPADCDVLVIIKRGEKVVKHAYIRASHSYSFTLRAGIYQPFFVFGNSWCPEKPSPNGQLGYFLEDVAISKDYPQEIEDFQELQYTLQKVSYGNFHAKDSNPLEAF